MMYSFRRIRRKLVPKLLICLSISLMCLLITFLAGIQPGHSSTDKGIKRPTVRCKVTAGLLQYFILSSFMWMLIQAINLYRSFITIFKSSNRDSRFLLFSFLFCTGSQLFRKYFEFMIFRSHIGIPPYHYYTLYKTIICRSIMSFL